MKHTGFFHTSLLLGFSLFLSTCGGGTDTVPGTLAVTDLKANIGPAEARLSWNIPPTGEMAEGYMIFRSTTASTIDVAHDVPVATTAALATRFTDSALTNYTNYYYVVAPMTGGVAGTASAEVMATPKDFSVEQLVRSSDIQTGDAFGNRVFLKNGFAAIAANYEDGGAGDPLVDSGAVYIFERDFAGVWAETAILRASDAQAADNFGLQLALEGTTLAVGTGLEDGGAGDLVADAGVVYIFERQTDGTWLETQVLHSSVMEPGAMFGHWGLDISGNTLVATAISYPTTPGNPATNSGAAFIFEKDATTGQWLQTQILRSSDIQATDQFAMVSLEGDTLVVGANQEDGGVGDPLLGAGAAYVFQKGVDGIWVETQKLMAPDAQAGDLFGSTVTLDGNFMAIGSQSENGGTGDPSPLTGAVYVYAKDANGGWQFIQQLHSPVKEAGERFSFWTALNGDSLLVGSYLKDVGAEVDAGEANLYTLDANGRFAFSHTFLPAIPWAGDWYGFWVAIDGSDYLIGAALDDVVNGVNNSEGGVYFY